MDKVIMLRYGELFLKGRNRSYFEGVLARNIKAALAPFKCKFSRTQNRYYVEDYSFTDEYAIVERLRKVFGLHSLSIAVKVATDYENIFAAAVDCAPTEGTFRVNVKRADKKLSMNSMQIAIEAGARILRAKLGLSVDLHDPEAVVNIDIRENGYTYIFGESVACAGGMPVGTAGRGMLLLSGGFDSPVAGWRMAKRGVKVYAVHYHSYPHTSLQAREKVVDLAKKLTPWCGDITLYVVPFTHIQEEIHRRCNPDFMITVMRRVMVRIAERLAIKEGCGCLITGESLGQVASQTMESITSTEDAVEGLPVFRPLIAMDKTEIMEQAEHIDTYDISKQPFEDCCTVFLPRNPVIHPKLDEARAEEGKLEGEEELIKEAIDGAEVLHLGVRAED